MAELLCTCSPSARTCPGQFRRKMLGHLGPFPLCQAAIAYGAPGRLGRVDSAWLCIYPVLGGQFGAVVTSVFRVDQRDGYLSPRRFIPLIGSVS